MSDLSFRLSKKLGINAAASGKTGSVIAILGVAFAVAVMEITLAVSVGFKDEITAKLQGFIAPISIYHPALSKNNQAELISVNAILPEEINTIDRSASLVPVVYLPGMLKTDVDFVAVGLKGYDDNYNADFEKSNIVEGRWLTPNDKRGIVISNKLAERLDLKIGERINLCIFIDDNVRTRPFNVVGIYDSGFSEFDNLVTYTRSDDVRSILHIPDNEATSLEIHGINIPDVSDFEKSLRELLYEKTLLTQKTYEIDTINTQGAVYLNWLDLLNTNVIVIFLLMALVAATTLVSSLFIQVLEKVNTIGLLRALGATNRLISRIFVFISLRLIGYGIIIGNIIGLGFILIQSEWQIISLDPEMYYLNTVPVKISWLTLLLLNIGVIIFGWLILLLPASIATRLSPSSTLRFD